MAQEGLEDLDFTKTEAEVTPEQQSAREGEARKKWEDEQRAANEAQLAEKGFADMSDNQTRRIDAATERIRKMFG